jgi:serine/threonine protein phosphatase PrpC
MLARWFDRSNIGQILAPDENATKVRPVTENDEGRAPLWQLLAPDPNFTSKPPPPPPLGSFQVSVGKSHQVLCVHCNRWTPTTPTATASTPVPQTPNQPPPSNDTAFTPAVMFHTPSPSLMMSPMEDVQQRVLSAAKDTAKSSTKPKKYRDARDQVFRICSNHNKLNEKVAKRLKKTLKKDPSLILARSRGLGVSCPDGNTPLMACAMANQVDAANIVLEAAEVASTTMEHPKAAQALRELHLHRDLEGRCALSIASETGSVDMVQVLLPFYDIPLPSVRNERTAFMSSSSLTPPIDLLGRTPLARAMTSPNPKARSNRKLLEDTLFSPMDPSILGHCLPLTERMRVYSSLHMAYGTADMPGKRILMEDAICAETWCFNNHEYSLLGVCDGHGDDGKVSEFVARNVSGMLRECMAAVANKNVDTASVEYWTAVWQRTCLQVDEKLKAADLDGGSTAILALITQDLIVVANVGDSRCVLIQTAPQEAAAANERVHGNDDDNTTAPSAEQSPGETSEAPELKDETAPLAAAEATINVEDATNQLAHMNISSTDAHKGTIVTPLSFDHKPELPEEKARVEKAGLMVATNTYEINGKEVTYHKIAKSEKDMVATSRSFGDFEYKQNTTLGPEEQAVSCVASVQVHKRDKKRDLYLVLACDGVWDVMENDQLMDFVVKEVKNKTEAGSPAVLPDVGDALVRECLALGSTDNMSAVLVSLQPEAQQIVLPTASDDLPPPKVLEFGSSPAK